VAAVLVLTDRESAARLGDPDLRPTAQTAAFLCSGHGARPPASVKAVTASVCSKAPGRTTERRWALAASLTAAH